MMKALLTIFFILCMCSYSLQGQDLQQLQSPNGNINFSVNMGEDGSLTYSVDYKKKPVILSSSLGIEGWSKNLAPGEIILQKQDTFWKPVYGERSLIRDHYNSMKLIFHRNKNVRHQMLVEVRAYDEGIAFRYCFPEHPEGGMEVGITRESTEFTLPAGTKAWFTKQAQAEYSLLPLNAWPGESERPLVLQLENGLYACLAEAAMVDYSRMRFILHPKKENTILCSMYDRVDLTTPFSTPWRVVMVAEQPARLIEQNDIILNLNPPCEIAQTDWIKPGKVMREITLSTKGAKELVDFAVKRNLQYIHFDAGWYGYEYVTGSDATTVTVDPRRNPANDLDLPEAIRYAGEKGIGVILYVNQRALYQQLDKLLPLYQQWGVKGIKFGFVHVGSHRWTTWMHDAVKKCAAYNLMVDIHDEYRPTGFSRTYPNLMTQEGILGNEAFPDATHNTVLPFTRFVAGPADYTICYYRQDFGNTSREENGVPRGRFIKTTSAHQLALAAVYYSPLHYMYWYDKPSDCQDEPELEFFDAIPTVWDDSKVLQGEIGKYIIVARRSNKDWFIGCITNTDARELKFALDFLPAGEKYEARIYSDDPKVNTRTKVAVKVIKVDSSSVLSTKLVASGGQAIWIRPLKNK